MKFKQYITEGRSESIHRELAIEKLRKHCKKACNSVDESNVIYRGVDTRISYAFIDPKKGTARKSANTQNYYTLINDNSPYWKKYPKRSESLICSTDVSNTGSYGKSYVIFPYDGSKIGVCPKRDYWFSFEHISDKFGDLYDFNKQLDSMFNYVNIDLNDKSYSGVVKSFKKFDALAKDRNVLQKLQQNNIYKHLLYNYTPDYNLLLSLQDMLHPDNNYFDLTKIGKRLPEDIREVWTDGKSIMAEWKYGMEDIYKLMDEVFER